MLNGNGKQASNVNKAMIAGSRLVFNVLGDAGYRIRDIAYSNLPKLTFGIAEVYDFRSKVANVGGNKLLRLTADSIFFVQGVRV